MSTPQTLRLQALKSGKESSNSPLKRRSMLNMSSSMVSPDVNNRVNDDEAERQTSRQIETSMSELDTAVNIEEHADCLSTFLKMYAENKINKENAWTITIIDNFSKLLSKHHDVLSNFQVAGTTLEASARVYGLRVDSVHNDVLRMTADLGRQSAKALQRKKNDDEHESDGGDKENLDNTVIPNDKQQKKKVKRKRNIATITQNVHTLNARLETNALTDPFFAKLNSVVGDTTSSKRLMQNIIPTEDSKLKLQQSTKFWKTGNQNFNLNTEENLTAKSEILGINSAIAKITDHNRLFLRQGLSNYVLSNMPFEDEDKDNSMTSKFNDDDLNATVINNSIHADLQFDINAAVEPVGSESPMVMDFGDMQNDDFDDMNEMELHAIQKCKGLKRQAILIDDMQPIAPAELEYSYRPMDNIDRFWAGPSHWKFRQSRRTWSIGLRNSMHPENENTESQAQKRAPKKRRVLDPCYLGLQEICEAEDDSVGMVVNVATKTRKTQLSGQTVTRKWDQKKLKLPHDHKIVHDILDKYRHMSASKVRTLEDVTFTGDDDGSVGYNYNNENDRNYCSRLNDTTSDTETETNTDMGQMDYNNEFDNPDMPPPPLGVDEIPDTFIGAPVKIEKINIAFAKRAKVVDMKQLKNCSWNLLTQRHHADPNKNPKFSETLKDLPKVLNKQMAENVSLPLAFYAILHLSNDKGLQLVDVESKLKDFEVVNVPS